MVRELRFSDMNFEVRTRCGKLTPVLHNSTITVHGEYPVFKGPSVPCDMVADIHHKCRPYHFGFRYGSREPQDHPRDEYENTDPDMMEFFADVIDYPLRPEQKLRGMLQTKESMRHPAKANIYMMEDIWRYVSLPGDLIVDYFGGIGTTGIAVREGRSVLLLELEKPYVTIERDNNKKIHELYNQSFTIMQGDNRKTLLSFGDGQIDHIMGSPPYAGAMTRKAITEDSSESDKQLTGNMMVGEYTASVENLGIANKFQYNMRMTKLYEASFAALKPGGTMTSIMADITRDGTRTSLSRWVYTTCMRTGFEVLAHFRRYMPGTSYKAVHKSRGLYVVQDEDIIIFRKPS